MDLSRIVWRKASRSNSNGGNCVEVGIAWRKASRSNSNGGDCVEVGSLPGTVAVRDSKDPAGPVLAFAPGDWQAFTASVKAGRHDLA
jgi:uncharacterized protein DUF397